jgi:hypothetical protein
MCSSGSVLRHLTVSQILRSLCRAGAVSRVLSPAIGGIARCDMAADVPPLSTPQSRVPLEANVKNRHLVQPSILLYLSNYGSALGSLVVRGSTPVPRGPEEREMEESQVYVKLKHCTAQLFLYRTVMLYLHLIGPVMLLSVIHLQSYFSSQSNSMFQGRVHIPKSKTRSSQPRDYHTKYLKKGSMSEIMGL